MNTHARYLGKLHALCKLGMGEMSEDLPPEISDGMPEAMPPEMAEIPSAEIGDMSAPGMEEMPGQSELTAEDFVNFVKEDDTGQLTESGVEDTELEDKDVAWGNEASLDAGDAGTRNQQLGLPVPGPV